MHMLTTLSLVESVGEGASCQSCPAWNGRSSSCVAVARSSGTAKDSAGRYELVHR
jgi:hypothetical protein